MSLLRDLSPLIAIQSVLMVVTLLTGGNVTDARVQLSWLGFLTLGWFLATLWGGDHLAIGKRYLAAMTSSVATLGVLAAIGSIVGFSMTVYLVVWGCMLPLAAILRFRRLRLAPFAHVRFHWSQLLLLVTVAIFVVTVFQAPRSNDIYQFMLQQQDMLAQDSLRVSTIGVTAMEIETPMPRWNAHYWHLAPCLIARVSGVAVDQVLLRFATIPVAFSVLLCLIELTRRLSGRSVPYSVALLAIVGPIILWHRNYNAFNYSFRITNNLLLDKDFALFFLVPTTLWLCKEWIGGKARYAIPLVCLIPAFLRFHPLTPVYLLLLLAPLVPLVAQLNHQVWKRVLVVAGCAVAIFASVVLIGDAQSNHEQIQQIIRMDFEQSINKRPTHYWAGFYNTIRESAISNDTVAWIDGRIQLKASLIMGCGLLLMMHFGLAAIFVALALKRTTLRSRRVMAAGAITCAMLWGMWAVSSPFLMRAPHYTAGYERLHWFAYPIALMVVATAASVWTPRFWRRRIGIGVFVVVIVSSLLSLGQVQSPLAHARGLNSLLGVEQGEIIARRERQQSIPPDRTLEELRPGFLKKTDRVLLLDLQMTRQYWYMKQGVFWADPYVEAFAFFHRGDAFLVDRRWFYDLLDRRPTPGVKSWLEQKGVTLIVDKRPRADVAMRRLAENEDLNLVKLEPGVWRIQSEDNEAEQLQP